MSRANQTLLHAGPAPAPRPLPDPGRGESVPDLSGTRYRARRRIGAGGMGVVYEAEHIDLGRKVALKILAEWLTADPAALQSFRQEARAASQLGAEQIVEVSDFAELPDGRLMYTMELLDGPTLREVLQQEGSLEAGRVIGILRQLCKGLGAAHAAGVVHRDIKPDNLVLVRGSAGRPDAVKILDFGLATIDERQQRAGGVVAGTPSYLPPEVIEGTGFDHRADQYAVGCTAYELLTGEPPFGDESSVPTKTLLERHMTTEPQPLSKRARIPKELEAVILRSLAKRPGDRFADMSALEAALCEAQVQAGLSSAWDDLPLPAGASSRARRYLGTVLTRRRPRSRRRSVLLVASGAVVVAGAAAWVLAHPPANPSTSTPLASASTAGLADELSEHADGLGQPGAASSAAASSDTTAASPDAAAASPDVVGDTPDVVGDSTVATVATDADASFAAGDSTTDPFDPADITSPIDAAPSSSPADRAPSSEAAPKPRAHATKRAPRTNKAAKADAKGAKATVPEAPPSIDQEKPELGKSEPGSIFLEPHRVSSGSGDFLDNHGNGR